MISYETISQRLHCRSRRLPVLRDGQPAGRCGWSTHAGFAASLRNCADFNNNGSNNDDVFNTEIGHNSRHSDAVIKMSEAPAMLGSLGLSSGKHPNILQEPGEAKFDGNLRQLRSLPDKNNDPSSSRGVTGGGRGGNNSMIKERLMEHKKWKEKTTPLRPGEYFKTRFLPLGLNPLNVRKDQFQLNYDTPAFIPIRLYPSNLNPPDYLYQGTDRPVRRVCRGEIARTAKISRKTWCEPETTTPPPLFTWSHAVGDPLTALHLQMMGNKPILRCFVPKKQMAASIKSGLYNADMKHLPTISQARIVHEASHVRPFQEHKSFSSPMFTSSDKASPEAGNGATQINRTKVISCSEIEQMTEEEKENARQQFRRDTLLQHRDIFSIPPLAAPQPFQNFQFFPDSGFLQGEVMGVYSDYSAQSLQSIVYETPAADNFSAEPEEIYR